MTKIEEKAVQLVKALVPSFSELEFIATIGDTSRSIEFFVKINNVKRQCYELADTGTIDEDVMERLFDDYTDFVRSECDFKVDEILKIEFSVSI